MFNGCSFSLSCSTFSSLVAAALVEGDGYVRVMFGSPFRPYLVRKPLDIRVLLVGLNGLFELDSDLALKSRDDFGSERATPLSRDKTDDVALSGRGSLLECAP